MRISDWSSDVCSSDLASEVAQRLAHILFGIGGHVLHDRAVAFDRDVHAIFVIIAAAMRDARAQLIEIAALDRPERIGDALKLDILGRVAADRRRCAPGVAVNTFDAGPVALVHAAGKPDAGLPAGPAADRPDLTHVETEP